MPKRVTPQQCIDAIVARDKGMPYAEVIGTFEITPKQFYIAVRDLESLLDAGEGHNAVAREISANPERKRELFDMGEEFVRGQYDRLRGKIPGERQGKMYEGTYLHPSNIQEIIYYALTQNNPSLASLDRATVIAAIQQLPADLEKYLYHLDLRGLMKYAFEKCQQNSPLAVLEVFDRVYQARTGDASLFDLATENHLHRWGDTFKSPHKYWKDKKNVEEAIYHILTEANPVLASPARTTVIATLQQLPTDLQKYLYRLGLKDLMRSAFEKGQQNSPLAVLEVFDRVYQAKTGEASLFDLTEEMHLHRWGDTFKSPNKYWKDKKNVEEAIYHTLTEAIPALASPTRTTVIATLQQLPADLQKYLHHLGLGGLMNHAFEKGQQNSPLAVLEVFDRVYQAKTGNASLFDRTQVLSLAVDGLNRLIHAA